MAEEKKLTQQPAKDDERTPKYLIIRDADGKSYRLEFNRNVVYNMQKNGFELDTGRLYLCARELVSGAFKMHHRWMEWNDIERVWKAQGKNRHQLLGYLARMFSKPALDLMGDGDDEEEDNGAENPTMEIVW